jgi:hypothetical protein
MLNVCTQRIHAIHTSLAFTGHMLQCCKHGKNQRSGAMTAPVVVWIQAACHKETISLGLQPPQTIRRIRLKLNS